MAWTAPMTAVANTTFTAAQYNTHVRDNFLETAPAKASLLSGYFVATGTNAIAQRMATTASNIVSTGTTTSSAYTATLTSGGTNPAVTVQTGERAFVAFEADIDNSAATHFTFVSYAVSGATSVVAADDRAIYVENGTVRHRFGGGHLLTGLTPGSNTFTMQYKTSAGTASYTYRRLSVIPF